MDTSSTTAQRSGMRYVNRTPQGTALTDRIARWTDRTGGCWLWLGGIDPYGYGRITVDGTKCGAHRASYIAHVGSIPAGLEIDHVCHSRDLSCPGGSTCLHRRCVNPAHLEPVTQAENSRRIHFGQRARRPGALSREREVCFHGHSLTETNTWTSPSGLVQCRECHRTRNRAYAQRKRAADKLIAARARGDFDLNTDGDQS